MASCRHTVLAAVVAQGNATRGGIASYLERKATDISHHLTVLNDAGLLSPEPDAFRAKRSRYEIIEPLARFYHAIVRPNWTQLERGRPGRAASIWRDMQPQFLSQVAGPTFERMCRQWTQDLAAPDTVGGAPSAVRPGVVSNGKRRISHELDVVAPADHRVPAIGEVKWGEKIEVP